MVRFSRGLRRALWGALPATAATVVGVLHADGLSPGRYVPVFDETSLAVILERCRRASPELVWHQTALLGARHDASIALPSPSCSKPPTAS